MKKSFQWLSVLALMVMSALAFVACSSDDDDDNGGGGSSNNSKILGTWVLTSVSSSDTQGGPDVGTEMTFKSDGTFTSGSKDKGTFTYDNSTGKFTASMNGNAINGTFTVNGNVMTGSAKVTENGHTATFQMTMAKKGTPEAEIPDNGELSPDVQDTRILGSWLITLDDDTPSSVGMTLTFKKDGTWSNGSNSGTYKSRQDDKGRVRFEIFGANGQSLNEGKLALVSEGNVLTGIYGASGSDYRLRLNMKKASYTYPTGGVKGRWLMKSASPKEAEGNMPIGEVMVFGNNNELYQEGDSHVMSYNYSGNTLTINLEEDGPMSGPLSISGKKATFKITMKGQEVTISLEKQN